MTFRTVQPRALGEIGSLLLDFMEFFRVIFPVVAITNIGLFFCYGSYMVQLPGEKLLPFDILSLFLEDALSNLFFPLFKIVFLLKIVLLVLREHLLPMCYGWKFPWLKSQTHSTMLG